MPRNKRSMSTKQINLAEQLVSFPKVFKQNLHLILLSHTEKIQKNVISENFSFQNITFAWPY